MRLLSRIQFPQAREKCCLLHDPGSCRVIGVAGTTISVYEGWHNGPTVTRDDGQWSAEELDGVLPGLVGQARPNADMTGEAKPAQEG